MATLADVPGRLAARPARPALVRRCRADGFTDWSTRRFVETVRQGAAGLLAAGSPPAIAWPSCRRAGPSGCSSISRRSRSASSPCRSIRRCPRRRCSYILADAGCRVAVVSDRVQAQKIQEVRHHAPGDSSWCVLIDAEVAAGDERGGPLGLGASVLPLAAIVDAWPRPARRRSRRSRPPSRRAAPAVREDDLATIIYTSGTTGEPKGVMLTHRNIVSNIEGAVPTFALTPADVALTFLPLSHSFERMVVYAYLWAGLTMVFAENLDTIARDLRAAAPTLMTVVPRVCEKLQARVLAAVAEGSAARRWLFEHALGARVDAGQAHRRRRPRGARARRVARDASATGWCSPRCAPGSAAACG